MMGQTMSLMGNGRRSLNFVGRDGLEKSRLSSSDYESGSCTRFLNAFALFRVISIAPSLEKVVVLRTLSYVAMYCICMVFR